MIKVLVCGIEGKMGRETANAVHAAEDLELVCGVDIAAKRATFPFPDGSSVLVYTDLAEAIDATEPDVMVDFTAPDAVESDIRIALANEVNCVVGTTGIGVDTLEELMKHAPEGTTLFQAPNFTTGAVLMMLFSKMASRFFPDAEVIEMHHDGKKDAPSGTSVMTAKMIAEARTEKSKAPGRETELKGMEGARGALVDGVPVHSVRTAGHVAHQEVIFGSAGQTLTIRHDSIDRAAYMPGVLLACREVVNRSGLIVGLENLMDLA